MSRWRIDEILNEIKEKRRRQTAGHNAWNSEDEDDPCAMAECDPSDQFCLGEEIEELKKELLELIAKL
jgi:hypothetical protein